LNQSPSGESGFYVWRSGLGPIAPADAGGITTACNFRFLGKEVRLGRQPGVELDPD
jgi:hypothetical protein